MSWLRRRRAEVDARTPEERRIDEDFAKLVAEVCDEDEVERPVRETHRIFGEVGVAVMIDPSDFGSNRYYVPVQEHELEEVADMAAKALARSRELDF